MNPSNFPPVIWSPLPGSQRRFLSCPVFEVLLAGSRGGGKTDSLLMDFAQHVGCGYGEAWRGMIFRRTYKQLGDVVAKSHKWFRQIFQGVKFNKQDYVWEWPTGEKLFLRYMDDPNDYWNYHGWEIPFIGWEELTNWPDNKCYDAMKSCCRSSDPNVPRKYRSTCNPFGVGHGWVKEYFVDPAPAGTIIRNEAGKLRVHIRSLLEENSILNTADPDYLSSLVGIQDENKRKAWLEGDWDIVAGAMFSDCWDPSKHILRPFKIPSSWYIDRSFDWGSSKPFSVGWWAESDGSQVEVAPGMFRTFPRGTLFRIAEYYGWNGKANEGTRQLAVDVARKIIYHEEKMGIKAAPGPADTSIFDVENGMSIADDMARAGVSWTKANKGPGSRVQGWEAMRRRFTASMQHPMEEPGLFVFDTCRNFIRTVPSLPMDEMRMDDIDTDAEDHCLHGDTLVQTDKGPVRIRDLAGTTGYVSVPGGVAEYAWCKKTREQSDVVTVEFADGSTVTCTHDHRFMTLHGWVEASELLCRSGHVILCRINNRGETCSSRSNLTLSKCFAGQDTISADTISKTMETGYTGLCGSQRTEKYPMDSTFTMSTETGQTTRLRTWSSSMGLSTPRTTSRSEGIPAFLKKPGLRLRLGTEARRGLPGTRLSMRRIARAQFSIWLKWFARGAGRISVAINRQYTAAPHASRKAGGRPELTTSLSIASTAERLLRKTATTKRRRVLCGVLGLLPVKSVTRAGKCDVYCMNVPGHGMFVLSNGVVSSNCADETRYRCLSPKHSVTYFSLGG